MKLLIYLISALVLAVARPDETYDSRFDNFNIDEVISSTRLMRSYVKCFLGEGKCTPDGNTMKKLLPEAVQTTCRKCSEKQKTLIAKMINALKENLEEDYIKFHTKYDPENKKTKDLEDFIEKYGKSN